MSAFICNPDHIKAIAIFAAAGHDSPVSDSWLRHMMVRAGAPGAQQWTGGKAEIIANILYRENVKSVAYRYSEPEFSPGLPGPCDRPARIDVTAGNLMYQRVRNPIHILKMCQCLEYQSCEHPDYRISLAYQLLQAIVSGAISKLPGYDDAPWEYQAA